MHDGTCVLPVQGGPCGRPVGPDVPFPLCERHVYEVTRFGVMGGWRLSGPSGPPVEPPAPRPAVVYYVRVGALVKIGTTEQDLGVRLQMLPPDRQILATEPGSLILERRRHEQFAHLREGGEWFRMAPELLAHVRALRGKLTPS
jgi:hypothetical protein